MMMHQYDFLFVKQSKKIRFEGARLLLFIFLNLLITLVEAQPEKSLNVSIISDPLVHDMLCVNDPVLLTCQVINATQPIYSWTASGSAAKLITSTNDKNLEVNATNDHTQYHCHVFDVTTNKTGEDSIIIFSNKLPPVLLKTNFDEVVEVTEGLSINLTAEVFSTLPLISEPMWSRMNGVLPSRAVVINYIYIMDEIIFTSLGLYNLSHSNDTGLYSLTASNRCGISSFIVYISVKDPHYKVCPVIPELLNASVVSGAFDGDTSYFECSFEADYTYFMSYWTITGSNQQLRTLNETNSLNNYSVRVYQDCFSTIECCRVTSQLTIINTPISLDNATVQCYAGLPAPNDLIISSDAILIVLVRPRLIMGPANVTVEQNAIAHFECHFNASTQDYLTIVEWLKDGINITNTSSNKYLITIRIEPEQTNVILAKLSITNISRSDEGSYSCICRYNTTILNRFHIYTPVIVEGLATLHLKSQGGQKQSSQEINTAVIIAVLSFSFILILLYLSYKGYKSIIKKRDNNNHNDEIINVPSNDTNTSIPSFKYESTSTNQSQKIGISYINDSSETSDIEGVEPQTFCISPSFNCEIEIEQLPHSPNAYLDTEGCNSLYKEPHSQSKAVSTVNCSSCDEVSQSILLDKNTIPFGNSEALSSECVELQPMEEASFNPKDFQPQYEYSSPIPITNICEIESEAQFHTPDLKATQSECSGENAMPIYDRKISSDMHDVQLADLQSTKNVDLNESEMINEQVVKVSSDLGSNTITDNIKKSPDLIQQNEPLLPSPKERVKMIEYPELPHDDIISSKICDHIDLMSSNNNSESLKEVNISCKRSITGDTKDVETIYSIQLNEISSKAASELSTATHNKLPDIKFMLNINYFTFLDISNNCIPHNIANGLAVALSSCIYLNLLNISHNSLSFNCVLEIVQVLRDCRNLQTLNLSYNIKSFVSEAEVLVDIILSVSSSLTCLNVCGRNIRPRFTGDYLSPPPGNKSSNRFLLHKLYLSQFISMYDVVFKSKVVVIPQNFKHTTEECPMQDKNTVVSYYVNHSGGTFYNQNHDFAIVVPPGAVLQDDGAVEIQATASYKCFKYYQFPNGYFPVSSIFWFSADYKFKIPVYLIMSHHASTKDLKDLCLTQACVRDLTISNDGKLVMKEVTDRVYTDNKIGYSLFITDHYCSLCLQSKRKELPNRFSGLFYTYDYKNNFIADLCFFPSNSDCRKELGKQYKEIQHDLISLSFELSKGESLYIPTNFSKIEGWYVQLAGKTEISYDDFEYWNYQNLEEFEKNMEYPPRFRIKCIRNSDHLNLMCTFVVEKRGNDGIYKIGQFPFSKTIGVSDVQINGNKLQHTQHKCSLPTTSAITATSSAEVCVTPTDKVLSKISKFINADWKHVGLQLEVKTYILNCISSERPQDKALEMLLKWKYGKSQSCYCELLTALRDLDLHEAVNHLEKALHMQHTEKHDNENDLNDQITYL